MLETQDNDGNNVPCLPTEIWLQIFQSMPSILSIADMMRLCRVNKTFQKMSMEAILESDILSRVGYWDPMRGRTCWYESRGRRRGIHPVTCHLVDSDSETESESILPSWYTSYPPPQERFFPDSPGDTSDEASSEASISSDWCEDDEESEVGDPVPTDEFWVMHLMTRTMGRIKSKPPTRDHLLIRKVAEYIWKWRLDNNPLEILPTGALFKDVVHTICEVAVKYGYTVDRRAFFLSNESKTFDHESFVMDETCAVFRDMLITFAVFTNEAAFLENILSREYPDLCPHQDLKKQPLDEKDIEQRPIRYRFPQVSADELADCYPPECGKNLIKLESPVKLAVMTGNIHCASIILRSLVDHRHELYLAREEIITTASLPKQVDFLRLAVESGPPLTAYDIVAPSLSDHLWMHSRGESSTRTKAGVVLSKMLETTTDLEVFDIAYEAVLAGYVEEEGVWWTVPPESFGEPADTLSSWGARRLQRAVLDDSPRIVQRLLQLGYSSLSAKSLTESKQVALDLASYLVINEATQGMKFPDTDRLGRFSVHERFFGGHRRRRKFILKVIRLAMEQRSTEMRRVLDASDDLEGVSGYTSLVAEDGVGAECVL
ncbi:altered inheritance of mitochondria 6 [Fusarium heterosporum]|uniref:Altered inheritance of mitochondria 6 n=1 Tax=Fusarium heterosporum TaxID=42747 RepID=A0A8H5WKS7_FUSHE|nr:altered inheritance of mitochondria 6 [Fusarium heterosporum]